MKFTKHFSEDGMKHLFRMSFCVLSLMLASMFGASVVIAADAVVAAKYEAAGNQLYQSGDFAKAIQYYQAAIQLDASKTASYVGLGNCQYRLGRKEEALTAYNKALALDPTNAQLTQFVNNLKGSAAVAAPALGAGTEDPLKQGTDLFTQKRYAESIPLFEQATSKDPGNAQIQYYWAYACAMTRDNRGAALHFYKFNMMSPNPGVQTYADRLKAGLPPEDQRWVEAQLAGATNVARNGKKAEGPKLGVRLIMEVSLSGQKDLQNYAKAVTAGIAEAQTDSWEPDPTRQGGVTIPSAFFQVGAELVYRVTPDFELGLSGSSMMVGKADTVISSKSAYVTYGGNLPYSENDEMKFSAMGARLIGRYFLKPQDRKFRPFIGAGPVFASASMKGTNVDYDPAFNDPSDNFSTNLKGSGIGGVIQVGADYSLGKTFKISPVLGFRFLSVSNLKGTGTDNSTGQSWDVKMRTITETGGLILVPTADPTSTGFASNIMDITQPFKLNLGGLQGGLMISAFF